MIAATVVTSAIMVTCLGIDPASAQTTDNSTMGNMTGGNITSGTTTEGMGGIASSEKCVDVSECQATPTSPPET